MGDDRREDAADKLNRQGEEPEVESGAGYGSHSPEPTKDDTAESASEEKSA